MRWVDQGGLEAITPVGSFCVWDHCQSIRAAWYPAWSKDGEVVIGDYRTEAAAKGACKRYAKKMAAAFKAMGKAGWQ